MPNTTQNKEELERAINKCARESSDGIFVYRYIKNYYEKALSQAHQSGIEEGRKAILEEVRSEVIGDDEKIKSEAHILIARINGRNNLRKEQRQKLSLLEGEK